MVDADADVGMAVLHVAQGGHSSDGVRKAMGEIADGQESLGHRALLLLTGSDVFDDDAPGIARPRATVQLERRHGPPILGYSATAERWITSPAAGEFDVLHQHSIWTASSRLTRKWRAAFGRPTVISPHGTLDPGALAYSRWKKRLALAAWEGANLREASCLHATAEQELAGFRDFGLRNPVAVISNGISDAWVESSGHAERFRARFGIPAGERVLLYFSRIHPKKNLLGLVQAMARLRHAGSSALHGWRLVIAGPVEDAGYVARVHEVIAHGALGDQVQFVGELTGSSKRDAYAAAELMVLPTLSDNFALVVAEALGAGVPVITTHGALPWAILEEHGCGWWIPLDEHSLAETLERAMRMRAAELAAMGSKGRTLVHERFRWSEVARQFMELYAWLRGDAPRPAFVELR